MLFYLATMLQDFSIDEKDYLFCNIRYMVAGTFQFTEYSHQIEARESAFRMLFDILCQNSPAGPGSQARPNRTRAGAAAPHG